MTRFSRSCVSSWTTRLFAILILGIATPIVASSAFTSYFYYSGTGSPTDMTGGTNVTFSSQDNANSSLFNIGFTFNYDGVNHTQFSVNTNGWLRLGSTVSTSSGNSNNIDATTTTVYPMIAPFWDDLNLSNANGGGGGVTYILTGTSPRRVLTVQWIAGSTSTAHAARYEFQARLYEGTNKIEFWYGAMGHATTFNSSASIGGGTATTNWFSWTPGNPATVRLRPSTANDVINIKNTPIASGTLYTSHNCDRTISLVGNPADGGVIGMANNSVLMAGKQVQRGSSGDFVPFAVMQTDNGCETRTVSYQITGVHAADYQISPNPGTVDVNDSEIPVITFTPGGVGTRTATLRVTDDNGFLSTYTLSAAGSPRIRYNGDISQGGTAAMNPNDLLMTNIYVDRNTSQIFTPFTIENYNLTPGFEAADISITLNDPSGQYSLVGPTTAALLPGETFTPQIRFSPTGVNTQLATITINAEGQPTTFRLGAVSVAPGGVFKVNGAQLGPDVGIFTNVHAQAGEQVVTYPLVVTNVGIDDFIIEDIDFYQIDTVYGQGVPRYPLARDRFGNLIPVRDYFITTQPGVAPSSANPGLPLPYVVPEGETHTLYISFVGQFPGKRFARAFIRTNGENFTGKDIAGVDGLEGLLNFELFGRSIGGRLADSPTGGALRTMIFPRLRVGDSSEITYLMYNSGEADLRISFEKLGITAGDVDDFHLQSAFGRTLVEGVPMTGDAILAPGASGSVTIRFKPQRGGSRRATLWIQTNDSSVVVDGVSERGAYYLDMYGFGNAALDYSDLSLPPAVIGGVPSRGVVRLVNSSTDLIGIASMTFVGGNASEFSEDATGGAWPGTPFMVLPGDELALGVQMSPTGDPGSRATSLRIVTLTGETIDIAITGEAGSQAITASPDRLFAGVVIPVGAEKREFVMIANTGTLPIRLDAPTITGAGELNYRLGAFPRLVLEPNAVEYLEVTYNPIQPGASTAELTITSDAGTRVVLLEGEGSRTRSTDPDPSATLPGRGILPQPEIGLNAGSTSSVREAAAAAAGVLFDVVRPNPARERAELVYHLGRGGDIRLELYDAAGRLVRELASGSRAAGEHRLSVDVTGLNAGVYHCRLTTGAVELSRSMLVVR